MPIIEMEVHMECIECERKIRRALSNIEGVHSVGVDIEKQKVTVSGYVDEMTVLEAVRNATGKRAELWAYPYSSEYNPYATHYFQQSSTSSSTYNYGQNNNGTVQDCYESGAHSSSSSYSPSTVIMDDKATTLFSDENPHACSVM
ncbi:hypothetical protein SUGI_1185940 [Cryptomeria japonica]|uniref:heavy metal-associated isoprenylated plant protein 45 isoform X2 n=1 Tax=Cryptomeria japonica TaxID=3369 RepID=UPI002414733E|nr:heavy metal-associated isoprenylated plant protein 45 isoform X2 [Cryptomeria japonica]GLJ55263.1 hypothetical protein SUGI_1185940 [Cryptomeria japonica]